MWRESLNRLIAEIANVEPWPQWLIRTTEDPLSVVYDFQNLTEDASILSSSNGYALNCVPRDLLLPTIVEAGSPGV